MSRQVVVLLSVTVPDSQADAFALAGEISSATEVKFTSPAGSVTFHVERVVVRTDAENFDALSDFPD